jgi:transcriptional regulator with XRE-family HTH domain
MTRETFAARLKRLREQAGLTQAELARRAGMHQRGIAKLEQAEREPTWSTVEALAAALNLDCTAFAGTSTPPSAEPLPPPPPAPRGRPKGKARGRPKKGPGGASSN